MVRINPALFYLIRNNQRIAFYFSDAKRVIGKRVFDFQNIPILSYWRDPTYPKSGVFQRYKCHSSSYSYQHWRCQCGNGQSSFKHMPVSGLLWCLRASQLTKRRAPLLKGLTHAT